MTLFGTSSRLAAVVVPLLEAVRGHETGDRIGPTTQANLMAADTKLLIAMRYR
jgi:hypothetical protein